MPITVPGGRALKVSCTEKVGGGLSELVGLPACLWNESALGSPKAQGNLAHGLCSLPKVQKCQKVTLLPCPMLSKNLRVYCTAELHDRRTVAY